MKHDLWASTALLREKGGSGAAGTSLWGESSLFCSQDTLNRTFLGKEKTGFSVVELIISETTTCHLESYVLY